MKKTKNIFILFCSLLTATLCSCSNLDNLSKPNPARAFQSQGIMLAKNYNNLIQINRRVKNNGIISDSDFDWLMTQLNTKSSHPPIVHSKVFAIVNNIKVLTLTQKQKLYNASLPLLLHPTQTDPISMSLDLTAALGMLAKTQNKAAIPYIKPLTRSSDPIVAKEAQQTITQISM